MATRFEYSDSLEEISFSYILSNPRLVEILWCKTLWACLIYSCVFRGPPLHQATGNTFARESFADADVALENQLKKRKHE